MQAQAAKAQAGATLVQAKAAVQAEAAVRSATLKADNALLSAIDGELRADESAPASLYGLTADTSGSGTKSARDLQLMRAGQAFARVAGLRVAGGGRGPDDAAQGRGGGGPGGGGPGGAGRVAAGRAGGGPGGGGWVGRSFPAAGREAACREWVGRGRLEGLRHSNAGRGRRAVRGCSLGLRDAGGTTGPPSRA